jgi:hypothetical protein
MIEPMQKMTRISSQAAQDQVVDTQFKIDSSDFTKLSKTMTNYAKIRNFSTKFDTLEAMMLVYVPINPLISYSKLK